MRMWMLSPHLARLWRATQGITKAILIDHWQHATAVSAKYADGADLHLSYKEWYGSKDRLYHQHGELKHLRREPEDEGVLQAVLKTARDKREKESWPAVFEARAGHPKQPARYESVLEKIKDGKKNQKTEPKDASETAANELTHQPRKRRKNKGESEL